MRIHEHPVLTFPQRQSLNFTFQGNPLQGLEGDTVASALHANGITALSQSIHLKRPRGFYCAIGHCASCNMTVNGVVNTRTCVTPLKEGMIVEFQTDKGQVTYE